MDNLTLAYLLIAVGLVLLAAELLLPSGGVLLVCAAACVVSGVYMTFVYGDSALGLGTLVGVALIVPVVGWGALTLWPYTPFGRRLIQQGSDEGDTLAALPANAELEALRGRFGRAVSALRPSGVAEFDGRRVDVITEGVMVEPGQAVRCVEVRSGRVLVRPSDPPTLKDLENVDFGS